jgi:hypothetical protein
VSTPTFDQLTTKGVFATGGEVFTGGALYLAGQDTGFSFVKDSHGNATTPQHPTVLAGDGFGQLVRDVTSTFFLAVPPSIESERLKWTPEIGPDVKV